MGRPTKIASLGDDIRALALEGTAYAEIARRLGCSATAVAKYVAESGMSADAARAREAAAAPRKDRDAAIVARRAAGETVRAIAADLGISVDTVARAMRDARLGEIEQAETDEVGGWVPPTGTARGLVRPVALGCVRTRVIGPGFCGASPDVEAADPVSAAADASPLWGGRYPRSPRVVVSPFTSCAAACVEFGR